MTDLTTQLDQLLRRHDSQLGQHRKSLARITDEFLKEAYRIVNSPTHLLPRAWILTPH